MERSLGLGHGRDNSPNLVDCQLFKKSFAAGAHASLATSTIGYVVLVN